MTSTAVVEGQGVGERGTAGGWWRTARTVCALFMVVCGLCGALSFHATLPTSYTVLSVSVSLCLSLSLAPPLGLLLHRLGAGRGGDVDGRIPHRRGRRREWYV